MRMRDLQTGIFNTLAADARLAGVAVSTHGGDFDIAEIKRYAKRTPAVVLALMHSDVTQQGGSPVADCSFVIVVVCEDRAGVSKWDQVIDYADTIARILAKPGQRWGLTEHGVGAPTKVAARNLYSTKLDAEGLALWGVAWRQVIDLAELTDSAVPLQRIHADWDLAPRDNAAPLYPLPGSVRDAEDLIQFGAVQPPDPPDPSAGFAFDFSDGDNSSYIALI